MPTTSESVRKKIVEALRLDLVGPDNSHSFATELLPDLPSKWYLTGYLIPTDAPEEQREDATSPEQIENGESEANDTSTPDRAASKNYLPSSMGLTVLVPADSTSLEATIEWGDYIWESNSGICEPGVEGGCSQSEKEGERKKSLPGTSPGKDGYRRIPRSEKVKVTIPKSQQRPLRILIPNSNGLYVNVVTRTVGHTTSSARLPVDTRSATIFIVNNRTPDLDNNRAYRSFAFQVTLHIGADKHFVPRPDLRGCTESSIVDEWDEKVADLHYRDVYEYVVGHSVSAQSNIKADGSCSSVSSIWIPAAEVERVEPSYFPGVELGMEALGAIVDSADASAKLLPLVTAFRDWIVAEEKKRAGLEQRREQTALNLAQLGKYAAQRIEDGIAYLQDPDALEAFRIMNRTMALAYRKRKGIELQKDPLQVSPPQWRPFQIAFIIMSLRGIGDPLHGDREIVDLLFFPTGGGKTEAYLGLAAFTMVIRRFKVPGIRSAGLSVLMRYTLRLLTLDQLGRATTLICALELERRNDKTGRLGAWPFEIGLWVGAAATPNRMGHRGYDGPGKDETAYIRTQRYCRDSKRYPVPVPLENCPWCGKKFEPQCFRLGPNSNRPLRLDIHCSNYRCEFSGDFRLPIIAVDEPIYLRLPAFVIATVDKFASLPWTGETGTLFGRVDRYDQNGFYGPCSPGQGQPLGGHLPPPDLIIQDELHLISGPLGTIAGVYETAIDILSSREINGKRIKPKIIASTATVRRAESQIRALFGRNQVSIFPPPGIDRSDSFFAHTESASQTPARLYLGIAAQGKSLKVVMLRTALALLSAAQTEYTREGGKKNQDNPADPYMTLLGYFNSLRELGGSRRIIEDEVRNRVSLYSRRKRLEPLEDLFSDRTIYEPIELTSRVSTTEIAAAKQLLSEAFYKDKHVDVGLATNMISVGLDIIRLGLMVVLGQPKASAEYIQASSRVGRDARRPGLVVTLLNVHKPRDRSHYERFQIYHKTFYRAVEPTSVTPFSPRALDRALGATLVALCRQYFAQMTPALGAEEILRLRSTLDEMAIRFGERAKDSTPDGPVGALLYDKVIARCRSLLDDWFTIADQFRQTNARLQYQLWEENGPQRLLFDILDPELSRVGPLRQRFKANRSMRDVEASVVIEPRNLNDWQEKK
jgi:hypothetical protein